MAHSRGGSGHPVAVGGQLVSAGATLADDSFHTPASADPFWTETAWFGFSVPERNLAGAVYPVFRPNQGVCSSGVYIWDDSAESQHDILYARNWWHLPMPDHDLTELSLPNGLRYKTAEGLRRYNVSFDDPGELHLDLIYEGLHVPHAPMVGSQGHLDQACHVQGVLRLHGEEIEVDGYDMRDRSWSVRKDHGPVRAGYDYAIGGPRGAFLAMSMGGGDAEPVVAGFRMVDGELIRLVSGERRVERDRGRPTSVRIEATDETGYVLVAEGRLVNRFAFQSSPNYFAWMGLTEWSVGSDHWWGQDQDVWSPDLLRAELAGRQA